MTAHGVFMATMYDCVFEAYFIAAHGRMHIYFKTDQTIAYINTSLTALISSLYNGFRTDYHNPASLSLLVGAAQESWAKGTRLSFNRNHSPESIKHLTKDKVSGHHHIHYTAYEIWGLLTPSEKEQASLAFFLPPGVSTTFMGGALLWLAALTEIEFMIVYMSGLMMQPTVKDFIRVAKAISVRAKSLQNLAAIDLRKLFEADVLVNRMMGDPVWNDEFNNRTKPKLAEIPPSFIYNVISDALKQTTTYAEKPRALSWEEFWAARWQWVAAGSVHTQYADQEKYIIKDRELRNKLITISQMADITFEDMISRKPEIHAWASVKYEWGKQRAIYGCDLTSYILSQYAFYNCEDTLPEQFPVGKKAKPEYVSAKVAAVLAGNTQFCFDFEDFNSQHSFDNMYAAIMAWKDTVGHNLTDQQKIAVDWTAKSLYKTYIHDNMGLKCNYKARGTLMSGWRLTTFINSLLNYAYMMYLVKNDTSNTATVHNGDDVLLGIKRLSQVQSIMRRCRYAKVRAQATKCALAAIGEFLRVDHVRGSTGHYLTRNIATLMHGRIESLAPTTAKDFISAAETRLAEFEIRSGYNSSLTDRLRGCYYTTTAKKTSSTTDDLFLMRQIHVVNGGLDTTEYGRTDYRVTSSYSLEQEQPLLASINLPAIGDYAKLIIKKLDIDKDISEVSERIYKNTLDMVKPRTKRIRVEPADDDLKSRVIRNIYNCYKDKAMSAAYGKAQLAGCLVDVLSTRQELRPLAAMVSREKNPLQYLAIVT